MGPDIVRADSGDAAQTSAREVEFALMISDVINSVTTNPEHLRAAVYELARHKLMEQYESESFAELQKLSKSLEVAIHGVEVFSKKREAALPPPEAAQSLIAIHASHQDFAPGMRPVPPVIEVQISEAEGFAVRNFLSRSAAVSWFAVALAIGLTIVFWVVTRSILVDRSNVVVNQPTSIVPKADTALPPQSAAPPQSQSTAAVDSRPGASSPVLPKSFGVYAVSDDKLYELDVLPGRAPDARIAISALITTQSRTTLPDGHLTFIVYRRDSATNAADRAEVRLIARIEREASFDKDGKQVVTSIDDNWVMRNISVPYRTAPKKEDPDMYEVRSDNPERPLAPGRYALVLKGLAYDFSVAGPITDPRQCLERLVANNGRFYSECKKH